MSSYPYSWERLAHQHGFDSFDHWVQWAKTKVVEEENEFRIRATRLMWGDAEARKVRDAVP
jgi:hypothetical protein